MCVLRAACVCACSMCGVRVVCSVASHAGWKREGPRWNEVRHAESCVLHHYYQLPTNHNPLATGLVTRTAGMAV